MKTHHPFLALAILIGIASASAMAQSSIDLQLEDNFPDEALEESGMDVMERQSLAYSNDRGRTWTKYEGKPVERSADFRYGFVNRMDGTDLVVWIKTESTEALSVSLLP